MKSRAPLLTELIILPKSMVSMVYIVWARLDSIWIGMTCDLTEPEPLRLIGPGRYIAISVWHVCPVAALVLAGLRARRRHPSLRKGHIASVLMAIMLIALIQYVADKSYGPVHFV